MTLIDFDPATSELARVVVAVRDDQLELPTPCPEWTVGALLDHVALLADGFQRAARKEPTPDAPPAVDAARLGTDWRTRLPEALAGLARAWADPAAWEGRTTIAGVESSGTECAGVALDEVVVHTWDLARATGQDAEYDDAAVAAGLAFADSVVAMAPDGVPGLFGQQTAAPEDASPIQVLVARTGRDPGWTPTAS